MKLVYFTSGPRERLFDALLAAGHEITAVYVTDPVRRPKVRPTLERAKALRVPVRIVAKNELEGLASEVRGAVCLSAGFAFLFPPALLAAAKLCLNVHGSLLPKYAGGRTLNWVIANGDRESGVTVHRMDEGVDTGPILLQRSFPLSPFDTARSLYRKTLELEPKVVVDALSSLENGTAIFTPQPAAPPLLPDRVPEHSLLQTTKPLNDLYNAIRASDPERYPAHFYVAGEKVCIRLWRPNKRPDEEDLL